MKKRGRYITWILVLLCILCLCHGCHVYHPVSYQHSGSVSVTVAMGSRSALSPGQKISVCVDVTGDYADEGHSVTLTVPANEADYYCYQKYITQQGEERIIFYVPIVEGSSQMIVQVLDERENLIYSRTCYYQTASKEEKEGELLVATVGISPENTIWNLSFSYGEDHYRVRTVALEPGNLLEDKEAYESYSLIVLSMSIAGQLEEKVKNGLMDWIQSGGCALVVGTEKTAQAFGFDCSEQQAIYDNIEEFVSFSTYEMGRGHFGVMDPILFGKDYSESAQITILEILLKGKMISQARKVNEKDAMVEQILTELNKQGTVTVETSSTKYIILFVVYLCVAFPVLYLILRKKDQMRYFKIGVCTAACLMSGIIWTIGGKTRFSKPFLNSITWMEYRDEELRETVCVSIQAPYNHSFEAGFEPEYQVGALQKSGEWTGNVSNNYHRHTASMIEESEKLTIRIDNLTAFSPRYFTLSKVTQNAGKIQGFLAADEDGADTDGRLQNQTGQVLEQALLFINDYVYLIENWEKEETLFLEGAYESGLIERMSFEQFLDGRYHQQGKWSTEYEDLYKLVVEQEYQRMQMFGYEDNNNEYGFLIALANETETKIQKDSNYAQSNVCFVTARVPIKIK